MHDLEPYYNWRDEYIASEDPKSPFFEKEYSEFTFSEKIYNHFIHPQWDDFGSSTLYCKILYADYFHKVVIIELIGEWNDAINNDIMILKRDLADHFFNEGICKFIIIGENILNFHSSEDAYYEEWYEDASEEGGWIALLNFRTHILEQMDEVNLSHYINYPEELQNIFWRKQKPLQLTKMVEAILFSNSLPEFQDYELIN